MNILNSAIATARPRRSRTRRRSCSHLRLDMSLARRCSSTVASYQAMSTLAAHRPRRSSAVVEGADQACPDRRNNLDQGEANTL